MNDTPKTVFVPEHIDVREINVACHAEVDILTALYEAWDKLPICPMLVVVSGAIQEIQALRGE